MSVIAISAVAKEHMQRHVPMPRVVSVDEWQESKPEQRTQALARERFLQPFLDMLDKGASQNTVINNITLHIKRGDYNTEYLETVKEVGKNGKPPSRSTISGWIKAYKERGRNGLLTSHTGRVRKAMGWESSATYLFAQPGKPSYSAVARILREDYGHESATDSAVRRYLQSLPASMGENSPARLGRKLYNNSQRHYIQRTTEKLQAGDLYQGDGHTLDVYLAHPVTGDIWRAELTVWMDVKSRYIVGWYISNAESSIDTIRCLSQALVRHDHVPALLYVDNGSGYASKMMSDEVTGFYKRLNMDCIFAIPGNAKAKGQVERWFRTMERDLNVFYGDAYCGEDMSPDVSTKFVNDCKAGKRTPPSLAEWCTEFEKWLKKYHSRPHPELKHSTPEKEWGQLKPVAVNMDLMALCRPQKERKVLRGAISIDNRLYRHVELIQWNRRSVIVEYDLMTDDLVTVRDMKGRFICDATLVKKADYIPESRLEEARKKSLKAAVGRLEKKIDEKKARAGLLLDHTDTLSALDDLGEQEFQARLHEQQRSLQHNTDIDLTAEDNTPMDSEVDIDLLNDDY